MHRSSFGVGRCRTRPTQAAVQSYTSPFLNPRRIPVYSGSIAAQPILCRRDYRVPINEIKKGQIIRHKDKIWTIFDFTMHTQGRMGSHYKLELREVGRAGKTFERFNAGTAVEGVDLDSRSCQFLYVDEQVHLLDRETQDEVEIDVDLLKDGRKVLPFLNDELEIKVECLDGEPVRVSLPLTGSYKVTYTDPPPSTSTNESKGMARFTCHSGTKLALTVEFPFFPPLPSSHLV
ncbi:hypothetical protein DFJ73DRAFT_850725 [Zopfochytrium polystomum]|nr:hypothetical protein DFJ73DRAFT_850725 [Zopfochytrium polystomum]